MNIIEKTVVVYSAKFTEEDLDLISYVMQKVWSFVRNVDSLFQDGGYTGFTASLNALATIRQNVLYNVPITKDNIDVIDNLYDIMSTFSSWYKEDSRIEKADALWLNISTLRTKLRKD